MSLQWASSHLQILHLDIKPTRPLSTMGVYKLRTVEESNVCKVPLYWSRLVTAAASSVAVASAVFLLEGNDAIRQGIDLLYAASTCSWGSKPTPPGTASSPLPPPAPAPFSTGVSATDFLAYQRLALSKMATNPALMGQHALKQVAALGMGGGASQSIYDGDFQGINTATATTSAQQQQQQQQQLMYY